MPSSIDGTPGAEVDLPGVDQGSNKLLWLENTLDTMLLGVTVTDVTGKIIYVNEADAHMHGYEVMELIGCDVGILGPSETRVPMSLDELEKRPRWKRERVNVRKDGSVFPVQLFSSVVKDSAGVPVAVVTTCEDITQRTRRAKDLRELNEDLDRLVAERTRELLIANEKLEREVAERQRAEQERVALESQLRQSQKLEGIGQLTGGIAHDFNNILSVIMSNAELLLSAVPSEETETVASLQDMRTAAQTGAGIIAHLLGFSRRAELRMTPTDLGDLVVELKDLLKHLIRENIEIRTSLSRPFGVIRADSGSVQQMIMNLVTNARDAIPSSGTISIALERAEVDDRYRQTHPWVAPGEYVCVSVTDSGIGMDKATLEKVFEPFFTTKERGKGTGLGMAMIYGLMKQHEGFVHIYSEVGEGTTVKLYFPVVDELARPVEKQEKKRSVPRGSETILVVEDEEILRKSAVRALKKFGYRVLEAANGAEGLATYRTNKQDVDLIVSDLIMPKLGGRDLLDAVRQEGSAVKFLFSSGYTAEDVQARTNMDPDEPFLRKPWTLEDLAQQVRAALDKHPN